jgi:hypothetical protein
VGCGFVCVYMEILWHVVWGGGTTRYMLVCVCVHNAAVVFYR